MKRNILVRTYDASGRPASGLRVSLWVYQFLASGSAGEKYTNSNGEVDFDLDIDEGAEISISINGTERSSRATPRGEYRFSV
jgi:hypothetical protein